ncbi:sirohydrochlorin chelatase [Streptomyces auratus]|uniref:Sirohydrochlorin chelatase n=1 Tax=Streptomyces auratus AGR0001 TaxID=1160718 RepID=J1RKG2_9ACTN|nr:CbiX/SirB N-terminal domain-containing protein [Streptomyces auratus]QTZ91799.1 sirohydrochlorin chelatase [Streptomyces auratus AGR0001]
MTAPIPHSASRPAPATTGPERPAPDDRPEGRPASCGLAAPLGTGELAAEITAQLSRRLSRVRLHGFRRQPPAPTLVAVAHGSRDPRALPAVRALLDRVRALRPGLPVRLGHVELNRPLLGDTLAELRGEAVLVPLLFGRGYHVTHDLPAALAAAPHLTGRIATPLGPHPLLAEALHGRLLEAGFPPDPGPRTAVVLAAAGSRSPRSAQDTARIAQLLSARLGGLPVQPAFAHSAPAADGAPPTVADAVRTLTARGHDHLAVAACFTAPGRFATRCADAAPGIAAAPLADHPALARLVLHRYDQALLARTGSDSERTRAATVAV